MLISRWVLVGCVFVCSKAHALNPLQRVTQYAHSSWTRDAGYLPGGVFAVTQTRDGNLWVGTEAGLLRFDGVSFSPWQAPAGASLLSDCVSALVPARDGGLWIGTRDGLSHWSGQSVTNYKTRTGPAGPGVTAVIEDGGGTPWISLAGYHSGGLCRLQKNSLHCYEGTLNIPAGVASLLRDRLGNLWIGGMGGLSVWASGAPSPKWLWRRSVTIVNSIAEDPSGQLWISTSSENGLRRVANGGAPLFRMLGLHQQVRPRTLLADRDGGLWIGTWGQGLLHLYQGRVDAFTHAEGLSNDIVRCLFEDHEGNIWAGTDGGLDRFREFAVTMMTEREGLSGAAIGSLSSSATGGVWIGTTRGLDRIAADTTTNVNIPTRLRSTSINALFEDHEGQLWVDSPSGLGYVHGDRFCPFNRALSWVTAIAEDHDRSKWVCDREQGLVRIRDERIIEIIPWQHFGGKQAYAIEFDPTTGGMWLGFSEGQIAHCQPGKNVFSCGPVVDVGRGTVTDLHLDRQQTLWIATQSGLVRLREGRLARLTTANGLACDRIHAMVEDNSGALWLYAACGLIRISNRALAAWSGNDGERVESKLYGPSDGMQPRATPAGHFRTAVRSNDGRLWFAALSGLGVVDPAHLPTNRVPPPVQIDQVTADGTSYAPTMSAALPPLTREVQISYAALTFVAPEQAHFRYRLDGFDTEWKSVGPRRQAVYTNLPPKRYRFRVRACNNDGVWNETGAAIDISIAPAFYQTKAFAWFCATIAGLLLWAAYRVRVRQLRLRYEARLAERARIARELHDTLLQNIAGLALQLEALAKAVTEPDSAKHLLRDLRRDAEKWLRETRESVWDLRTQLSDNRDLLTALREAGQQVTNGRTVDLRITAAGRRRPAPPELQEQLLKIVQEAIRNAVQHGAASQIRIHVSYLPTDRVRIEIRDDGCGFDVQNAQKIGHWGLATMQERARHLGADLKIAASPGHGAEIVIIAPIQLRRNSK